MAVITGTARPGEFLTSDTAGQWAINGLPLIGHTGYRLLVPWTAVPGDLITQGEVSNTVPVPAYDADAADYFSRAETAGGSFLSEGVPGWYIKWRIDAMYRRLKDTGAWSAIAELYLMMGVGFGGLAEKAKYYTGVRTDLTLNTFVAGDYAEIGNGGGLSSNGSQYINTELHSSVLSAKLGIGYFGAVPDGQNSGRCIIANGSGTSGHASLRTNTNMRMGGRPRTALPSTITIGSGLLPVTSWFEDVSTTRGGLEQQTTTSPIVSSYPDGTFCLFSAPGLVNAIIATMSAAWVLAAPTEDQVLSIHSAVNDLHDDLSRPTIAPARNAPIVIRSPMKNVLRNSTGNRATVRLIDSYGEPLTGIPAGDVTITAGPEGGTAVPVAVAGSWTERSGGRYDFAMPDALYTGTERIYIEGTLAGGTVLGDCHQIVGYDRLEPWATPGDIAAIGAVIPGDDAQTLTFTCTADSQPVAGVVIRIAGRRLVTDTAGVATIDLDPGSYTARYMPPAGFDAVPDGAIVIAAAPVSVAVSLEQQALDPGDSTACPTRFITLNQFDAPARGITIQVEFLRLLESPSKPGIIVNTPEQLTITNADAFVDAYLHRNALYQATFSRGTWRINRTVQFTTPNEGNLIVMEPV